MKVNSNRKGKIILKVLVILLALVVAAGIILACYYLIKPAYGDVETVTVGNSKTLTVGVISDTQLPNKEPEDGNNKYKEHTEKALQLFKNQGVDVIVLQEISATLQAVIHTELIMKFSIRFLPTISPRRFILWVTTTTGIPPTMLPLLRKSACIKNAWASHPGYIK